MADPIYIIEADFGFSKTSRYTAQLWFRHSGRALRKDNEGGVLESKEGNKDGLKDILALENDCSRAPKLGKHRWKAQSTPGVDVKHFHMCLSMRKWTEGEL